MRTRTGWNGARFPPRSFSPYTGCVLGISGPEFLVIVLVAVIVIGPQRLPEYTRRLTQAVRRLRVFLDDTKEQIAEEVGPELADLNLSDLDPRNYDPRKIVRDALGEDLDAIRRDLATPFQSTVRTAKDATDEAAGTFNAQARSRSKKLTRMIDDKAHEAHSASAPSDVPGEETVPSPRARSCAPPTPPPVLAPGLRPPCSTCEPGPRDRASDPGSAGESGRYAQAQLPSGQPAGAVGEPGRHLHQLLSGRRVGRGTAVAGHRGR